MPTVISLFVAIVSHKWIEAFALGAAIVKTEMTPVKHFIFVGLYAIGEPLGVVAGMGLAFVLAEDAAAVLQALVLAFASGTFIYIAAVDILPMEFADSRDKYIKFLICFVGAAAMCGIGFAFQEE